MAFDSSKIKEKHVFNAAKLIERRKLRLRKSIGYDVIIDGKRYPPKEIVRIS